MIAEFASMNGPTLRNVLTTETRLDVLRELATDKRKIVADKAQRRLAQLGATLGDGGLDNTGSFEGPVTEQGIALELAIDTAPPDVGPTGEDPFDRVRRENLEKHGVKTSKRPKKEPTPLLDAARSEGPAPLLDVKPDDQRKRTSRRKNLPEAPAIEAAPVDQPATEETVKPRRKRQEPWPEFVEEWEGKEKKCPHCLAMLDIVEDFGPRVVAGTKAHPGDRQIPQPWCRDCRRKASKLSATNPKRAATKAPLASRNKEKAKAKALREKAADDKARAKALVDSKAEGASP